MVVRHRFIDMFATDILEYMDVTNRQRPDELTKPVDTPVEALYNLTYVLLIQCVSQPTINVHVMSCVRWSSHG